MKKQILIIHGGTDFDTYEEFLENLKEKEITIERIKAINWKETLGDALGNKFEVLVPQMPNKQNAKYTEWKIWFEKIIKLLNEKVILIGHSLGGIFLAKYLSENDFPKKIIATFLIAAPHTMKFEHSLASFTVTDNLSKLGQQGGEIFLYHSKDDNVVKYSNFEAYMTDLPKAHARIFKDRQHFTQENFPELAEDIKSVKW